MPSTLDLRENINIKTTTIKVVTVSKLCSGFMDFTKIKVPSPAIARYEDILLAVYRLCPNLQLREYGLYWRYSKEKYLRIVDFLSYICCLILDSEKIIYLLLNDCDEGWKDNVTFLSYLDRLQEYEKTEKERTKYDIKIPSRDPPPPKEDPEEEQPRPRSPGEIINFAYRKYPEMDFFTSDYNLKKKLIRDLKKGTREPPNFNAKRLIISGAFPIL